jgi:hypothetical protein
MPNGDTSEKAREQYIRHRIKDFFSEEHFSNPAIKADEAYNEDYAKKADWEDIKTDRTAIGFDYLIGEEAGRHIAYSKKQKKVVLYFSCC